MIEKRESIDTNRQIGRRTDAPNYEFTSIPNTSYFCILPISQCLRAHIHTLNTHTHTVVCWEFAHQLTWDLVDVQTQLSLLVIGHGSTVSLLVTAVSCQNLPFGCHSVETQTQSLLCLYLPSFTSFTQSFLFPSSLSSPFSLSPSLTQSVLYLSILSLSLYPPSLTHPFPVLLLPSPTSFTPFLTQNHTHTHTHTHIPH